MPRCKNSMVILGGLLHFLGHVSGARARDGISSWLSESSLGAMYDGGVVVGGFPPHASLHF